MRALISYILIIILFVGFCTTSCQSDEIAEREEVRLQVVLDNEVSYTRANVAGTAFDTGDTFRFFFNSDIPVGTPDEQVSTTGNDDDLKKTDYAYAGSNKWTTEHPIYWDDHKTIANRPFCAVIPFSTAYEITEDVHTFSIKIDQSVEANYKASDVLLARTETSARLVPLNFRHMLSKIVVNVTASSDTDNTNGYFEPTDLEGMTVRLNQFQDVAKLRYNTPIVLEGKSVTVEAYGETVSDIQMLCTKVPENNTAAKQITATYTAVVPPQTISTGNRLVVFTLKTGDVAKEYYFKDTFSIVFEQNMQYTINIVLVKNKVELSTEDSSISINPWGTITAGDSTPIVLPKD